MCMIIIAQCIAYHEWSCVHNISCMYSIFEKTKEFPEALTKNYSNIDTEKKTESVDGKVERDCGKRYIC